MLFLKGLDNSDGLELSALWNQLMGQLGEGGLVTPPYIYTYIYIYLIGLDTFLNVDTFSEPQGHGIGVARFEGPGGL